MFVNLILAIIITITVISLPGFIGSLFTAPLAGQIIVFGMVGTIIATGIWAYVDSARMRFKDYDVSFPSTPIFALLLVCGVWIVGFPWFLTTWLGVFRKTYSIESVDEDA